MQISFTDQVVLVTGASTGIGAALAKAFGAAGARVAVHYNSSADAAEGVVAEITGAGGQAQAFRADLSEPRNAPALAEEVTGALGEIDVLVNNAGGLVERRPTGEVTPEFVEQVLALNVGQVAALCDAVVPGMRDRGRGSVVTVGSVAAVTGGGPGAAIYATSKGAITTYTRALAKEMAPHGVRVNCLAPGVITTPFHEKWTPPEAMTAMVGTIPMGRAGDPEDCVGPVLFLASDELSGYVTGQVLPVNGGQHFLG